MKIAVMVNSLMSNTDGIARHATYFSRELISMGHQVTIWAVEYDKEHCELVNGLDVRSLRDFRRALFTSVRIPGLRMLAWLRSFQLVYRDQMALFKSMSDGYQAVYACGNLIVWAAAEYKRKFGVPVVWMCDDFWPPVSEMSITPSTNWQKMKVFLKKLISLPIKTYDLAAVKQLDEIAVLSELVRKKMAEYYGISPEVVRLGVNYERFTRGDGNWVKSHHPIPDRSFLLFTICSFMPRRRLEDVIRAIETLVAQGENITYLIAGRISSEPEYTRFIRAEVAARHLEERVLIIGEVQEDDLVNYYQACDVFIWPADENQSWGMAGTEAMASGKPIIVCSANGLSEILIDRVTGFVIPPRSPEMIALIIKQLLSDPALVRSVGKAGQRLICENYTWRNNAQHMLSLSQPVTEAAWN